MQHRDHVAQPCPEPRQGLWRECDLGDEHDRGSALRQGRLDGPQVDLGLARTGDAVQQQPPALVGAAPVLERLQHLAEGVALIAGQRGRRTRAQPDVDADRSPHLCLRAHVDETALLQAAKRRGPERGGHSGAVSLERLEQRLLAVVEAVAVPQRVTTRIRQLGDQHLAVADAVAGAGGQEQAQRTRERRAVLVGHPARQLDEVGRHAGRQHRVGLGEPVGIEL